MKKFIFSLAFYAIGSGAMLTSCGSGTETEKKVEDVPPAVNKELAEANAALRLEIQRFRSEMSGQISDNDAAIAKLKISVESGKLDVKNANKNKIAELERKNRELKFKLNGYNEEDQESWDKFKLEIGHDMDDMNQSLKLEIK